MTITSGFFRSVGGDRKYTADFFTSYFASFIANGVFPNPSDNLQVLQFQNMQTIVRPGKAWINGNYMINDSNFTIQHQISNGTFARIDRIVVGLNFDTRDITLYVKTGNPSAVPVAPSLTRNATLYELALADVLIPQGSTQISQSNITDTRLNTQLCGIVHGLVEQVDTTTLYNQYLAAFQNFTDSRQAEFDAFLADLQDTLDGNVAANLLVRIQRIEEVRSLNQFNLIDGTKDFSGNFLRLAGNWTLSNANDSYQGLTTYQRTGSLMGPYKNVLLEVGNYTFSAIARSTGSPTTSLNIDALSITPAAVTNIVFKDFTNINGFTLLTMEFTVTQRGYVSPRVQNAGGNQTLYIAGYNLYKGHYTKSWFPSINDILNQPIPIKSTQAQALSGTDDNTFMTPLRVKDVADTKLNLSGGTLTGNLIMEKGVPVINLVNPNNSNVNLMIRLNASGANDFGAQLIKNGQTSIDIRSGTDVRFNHASLGTFTVQDAFDKLQAQATTPTTPIANGKFIGVYE